MCLVRGCRSETQELARHASARKCRPANTPILLGAQPCFALPCDREHRAAQGMAGYGCSPCHVPDLAVDGQARPPFLCLQYMKAAV